MLITVDTDKENGTTVRALVGFLIHLYNLDPEALDNNEVPEGTTAAPLVPAAPSAATSAATATSVASVAATAPATVPTAPALASNVLPFPVPPPPPIVAAVVTSAAIADVPAPNSTVAPTAAAAQGVASAPAEYDTAGLPWDSRIHQKAKGTKKDGTWKLIKGIDDAVVMAVMPELLARKLATTASPSVAPAAFVPPPPPVIGAVPPPPATVAPQVFLPFSDSAPGASVDGGNTMPVSSVSGVPAPPNVFTQTVVASVPVPPVAPVGVVGAVTYRALIDKMTAGTKTQVLTAAKVMEIVQACNCPNLQQLNQMPQIFADVDAKLDLALAGLL